MKRFVACFVLVVTFANGVQGQLLWKIHPKNSNVSSYIFGTHHLIDKNRILNFNKILKFCDNADLIIGEIDMSTQNSEEISDRYSKMSKYNLRNLVSKKDYGMLNREFQSLFGINMNQLDSLKPMALISLYQVKSYMQFEGLTKQPVSVDFLVQVRAKTLGKKVIGLETLEEQMNILMNSLSLTRQAKILVENVKRKDSYKMDFSKLENAYLKGDLPALQKICDSDESMTKQEKELFSENRNFKWMKRLVPLFNEQTCFVAVGCMHLVGENGLIQQLRTAGFEVEPVQLSN